MPKVPKPAGGKPAGKRRPAAAKRANGARGRSRTAKATSKGAGAATDFERQPDTMAPVFPGQVRYDPTRDEGVVCSWLTGAESWNRRLWRIATWLKSPMPAGVVVWAMALAMPRRRSEPASNGQGDSRHRDGDEDQEQADHARVAVGRRSS